eukprot:NODE_428_length_1387_cov_343.842302_g314_i0.p3 GENE.NODE_428_length_1387_cov_343.842302_g314_i0~~NODE_428_length_1387_cov_343.842302_g314_i0.p3  ORF type:complete len:98 (+),score=28.89 NODE_428_length_1387_cov_343.842302_g314_i0:24-296(+)
MGPSSVVGGGPEPAQQPPPEVAKTQKPMPLPNAQQAKVAREYRLRSASVTATPIFSPPSGFPSAGGTAAIAVRLASSAGFPRRRSATDRR